MGPVYLGALRVSFRIGVERYHGVDDRWNACERPPLCGAHRPPRLAIGPRGLGGDESAPEGRWGWAIGRVSPRVRTAIGPTAPLVPLLSAARH